MSKEAFYKAVGITRASFSQWRTGRTSPSSASLHKVADVLGVSYEYLIAGNAPALAQKEKPTPKGEPVNTNETMQLLSELSGLSDAEVHKVLEYTRFVKSQRS